jgi:hypothetical protein
MASGGDEYWHGHDQYIFLSSFPTRRNPHRQTPSTAVDPPKTLQGPQSPSGGVLKHADTALLAAPPRLAQRSLHNLHQETAEPTEDQGDARSEYHDPDYPPERLRLSDRLQRWRLRKRLSSG